jgi:hypothetical protein
LNTYLFRTTHWGFIIKENPFRSLEYIPIKDNPWGVLIIKGNPFGYLEYVPIKDNPLGVLIIKEKPI